jgi:hypothetical protein
VNSSKFDRLFAEGREALLSGSYRTESALADGVARWGIGAVLRPDPIAAQAIEQAAAAVAGIVGDNYWLAGGSAQLPFGFAAG